MEQHIPHDPMMLLSFINMKLRDFYSSFDTFCDDFELDLNQREEILNKLAGMDYHYDETLNKFV